MRITSLTIRNFQCFGDTATTIRLNDLTAFVGMNGAGKTAILQALVRLFGSPSERRLERRDFHVPFGADESKIEKAELVIEARIDFSDCEEGVAELFDRMAVSEEGKNPYCRVRLEGKWERSSAAEGDIEDKMYWVRSEAANLDDNMKSVMPNAQRSLIQVTYVPASRDPGKQLRQVSGTVLHKLMKAVEWKDETRETVKEACLKIRGAIVEEVGVSSIQNSIAGAWEKLYTLPVHSKVKIRAVTSEFADLLKNIEAVFEPGEAGAEAGIDKLSDGMKSLFYFCLIRAGYAIEESCRKGETGGKGLMVDELKLAALNIFVIEEPENHLSPHYLGRIISELKEMSSEPGAQVLVTSQSTGILKRVDPRDVRYVRLEEGTHTSTVRRITLPKKATDPETHKFVKEAVQAYPELYFSSFVILGEGDSEEIVIPKLAEVSNLNLDHGFVSVVPLGGRHVNHFWRLLNDLKIPFVTLLDLDRERYGGGWGRVKYVCDQLLLNGTDRDELLKTTNGVLSDTDYDKMPDWPLELKDVKDVEEWCEDLESYGVYFSSPLDLDFLMFSSYPQAYKDTADEGPQIPKEQDKLDKRILRAVFATLKQEGGKGVTYSDDDKKDFIWYSYLFLNRGKPVTHLEALNSLKDSEIKAAIPPVLKRLVKHVSKALNKPQPEA